MCRNIFRDLALNCEHIRCLAVVVLSPQMRVGAGVDQLRVDANFISKPPDASLQEIRHVQFVRNFSQISLVIPIGHY